jgi:ABC-type glutathione transport system ATPase component
MNDRPRPALVVDHVSVRFAKREANRLNDISLRLAAGDRLVIVGESGAGKSTLLRAVSGFAKPYTGWISVNGLDPYAPFSTRKARRHMGQILQLPRASLDPVQSVLDAVAEPLIHLRGKGGNSARMTAADLLLELGIEKPLHNKQPHLLSGGECQRVAVARALVHKPQLILADEPTASLDPITGEQLVKSLSRRVEADGLTTLYVTHVLQEAPLLRGQLAVLLAGCCVERITEFSSWTQVEHPYSKYLARAIHEPVPGLISRESGCPFANTCALADGRCKWELPDEKELTPGHSVRCFAL